MQGPRHCLASECAARLFHSFISVCSYIESHYGIFWLGVSPLQSAIHRALRSVSIQSYKAKVLRVVSRYEIELRYGSYGGVGCHKESEPFIQQSPTRSHRDFSTSSVFVSTLMHTTIQLGDHIFSLKKY